MSVVGAASTGAPVVVTSGLSKQYGAVRALDALTVEVGPGITGLVGANGAGKSTLIKILLGLVNPTGGSASVLGHDIATQGREIRSLVGYLPEHDCLPPDVSASDFVVHLAMMSGLPGSPPGSGPPRCSGTSGSPRSGTARWAATPPG